MNNFSRNSHTTNNQACAACKYQRKKCAPDCILAPYFPHDRPRQFLNAHKLFGVKKITKIIEHLDPHHKDQAMRSIIFQSDMRAHDPVGGCFRYIKQLHASIESHQAELELVLQQLAVFRADHQPHHHRDHSNEFIDLDHLNLYNPTVAPPPSSYQYLKPQLTQQEPCMIVEHHINNDDVPWQQDDVNTWALQDSVSTLSSLSSWQNKNGDESSYVGDESYSDHKSSSSMLDFHCDNKNEIGFEPEELVDRSDEGVLFKIANAVVKEEADCIQQVQDHDLKGAATLFTLTNCTT